MRRDRVLRPIDDPRYVVLDLESTLAATPRRSTCAALLGRGTGVGSNSVSAARVAGLVFPRVPWRPTGPDPSEPLEARFPLQIGLVGDPGLEPGTSSLSEKRSNRLS